MRTRQEIEAFAGFLADIRAGEPTPLADWLAERDDPRLWVDLLRGEYRRLDRRYVEVVTAHHRMVCWDGVPVEDPEVVRLATGMERLRVEAANLCRVWYEVNTLFQVPIEEEVPF